MGQVRRALVILQDERCKLRNVIDNHAIQRGLDQKQLDTALQWLEEIDTALKWIEEKFSLIEENKRAALESEENCLTADMGPYGRMK